MRLEAWSRSVRVGAGLPCAVAIGERSRNSVRCLPRDACGPGPIATIAAPVGARGRYRGAGIVPAPEAYVAREVCGSIDSGCLQHDQELRGEARDAEHRGGIAVAPEAVIENRELLDHLLD